MEAHKPVEESRAVENRRKSRVGSKSVRSRKDRDAGSLAPAEIADRASVQAATTPSGPVILWDDAKSEFPGGSGTP